VKILQPGVVEGDNRNHKVGATVTRTGKGSGKF